MTCRKIVAIWGGENGRLKQDGIRKPYETGPIDQEIIRLTGKEHPNFLFLWHAQPIENQDGYFIAMRDIYGWRYGCECKDLKTNKLMDTDYVNNLINWADIIYEWWWDTSSMIMLWKETWFDSILRTAWENGKVVCGLSAWWNCWFNKCSSDALSKYGDNLPLIKVNCLWFVNWLFLLFFCLFSFVYDCLWLDYRIIYVFSPLISIGSSIACDLQKLSPALFIGTQANFLKFSVVTSL